MARQLAPGTKGTVTFRGGATIRRSAILRAAQADDCLGFCVRCGAEASGVEPDARKYVCEQCGAPSVYGAEEIMLRIAW